MKKLIALMLAMLMALSLVACGGTASNDADTNNDDASADDSLVVLENVVDWGETEPYRVLVQKGDPKGLLPAINAAIAKMNEENKLESFISAADALKDVWQEVTAADPS